MRDIDRIKHLLASHKMELREEFKVRDIGVFGSYIRGEQRKASDIDILGVCGARWPVHVPCFGRLLVGASGPEC